MSKKLPPVSKLTANQPILYTYYFLSILSSVYFFFYILKSETIFQSNNEIFEISKQCIIYSIFGALILSFLQPVGFRRNIILIFLGMLMGSLGGLLLTISLGKMYLSGFMMSILGLIMSITAIRLGRYLTMRNEYLEAITEMIRNHSNPDLNPLIETDPTRWMEEKLAHSRKSPQRIKWLIHDILYLILFLLIMLLIYLKGIEYLIA